MDANHETEDEEPFYDDEFNPDGDDGLENWDEKDDDMPETEEEETEDLGDDTEALFEDNIPEEL